MVTDLQTRITSNLKTKTQRHSNTQTKLITLQTQIKTHKTNLNTTQTPLISNQTKQIHKTLQKSQQNITKIQTKQTNLLKITQKATNRHTTTKKKLTLNPNTIDTPTTTELIKTIHNYQKIHQQIHTNIQTKKNQTTNLLHNTKQIKNTTYSSTSTNIRKKIPITNKITQKTTEIPYLLITTNQNYLKTIQTFPSKIISTLTLTSSTLLKKNTTHQT